MVSHETKTCGQCEAGVLSERVWGIPDHLCPNPKCSYSPTNTDPQRIAGRWWERVKSHGLWWWAQVR